MAEFPKIRFQGNEYLIIGSLEEGGAIATKEQYESGEASFAHLYRNGQVKRFGQQIGTREEIELIGREFARGSNWAIVNILTHPSWGKKQEQERRDDDALPDVPAHDAEPGD